MQTSRFIIGSMAFALFCHLAAAAEPHAFYVLETQDSDHATLFATRANLPKSDLPFVQLGKSKTDCCFRFGRKPGAHKAPGRIGGDPEHELTSENDAGIFKYPGYIALSTPAKLDEIDISFGIEGMTNVTAKGKSAYAITFADSTKPVILRYCYSSEGLHLDLFHTASDKQPYATYYYYLGIDLEGDCKEK